jgi:hypothetical protein
MDARVLEEPNPNDHVPKLIELTGTSTASVEDAVGKTNKWARGVPRAWICHSHLK